MKFFYTFIIVLVSQYFFGQNGTISGTVLDDANGRSLPGVNIVIKDLKLSTSTDPDGKFVFRNVAPGIYEVELSFIGFKPKAISEVVVKPNESTTLNTTLAENKNELNEVVITRTKAKTESVKSLLVAQKNNASVSDGISAETIKRTPDKTTSDVLKRISGASIQDNKFVIIRGLNDRYNVAFLNGAPLPSSEPDRKAFSFDIFPSNMLDNLVITKTASPDLPGEFAGGVIQINTKSVPDKNFQTLSVGTGYNTITTFKTQKTYAGSSTDWLGFDNGARAMPSTIPNISGVVFNTLPYQEAAAIAKSSTTDWNLQDKRFKPNMNFQYSIGHHFDFKDKVLGVLFSISNNQTKNYNETTSINEYDEQNDDPKLSSFLSKSYATKNYTEQVLTAGLANFSFKFNENHSLTLKNIYSINSTDLVSEKYGQAEVGSTVFFASNVRWFTSNKIYSGQLNGENYFAQPKIKINWTGFYSNINRSIPNLRRNVYYIADPNSTDPSQTTPIAVIATTNSGGSEFGGGMFYSENKETISGGKIDISRRFTIGEELVNELKIGGFTQKRDRDFFARQLQYKTLTEDGIFEESLLLQPDATIFSQANMGVLPSGKNGFTIFDASKLTDAYKAGSKLNAGYIMLDNKYKSFRLVWGVRIEDFRQTLGTELSETKTLNLDKKKTDILPSINLIYSVNKKQNLRLSYSKTLNRPEFRELAPFGFYDFTTGYFTQGNENLERATVQNIDFRYEIYPGKGQILSFSYFNKKFTNPIESVLKTNRTLTYDNAKSAKNSGIEIEFRTLLSSVFTSDKTTVFDDITLFSNVSIIKSKVDVSNIDGSAEKSRPLQGQSPYIFNAGLQYLNKDNGWALSINANRAGNRIATASSEGVSAVWEKARTFLDMQIAKSLYKNKLELKFNIQNLLAQDLIFYQNNYKNTANYGTVETLANHVFTGDYHYENGFNAKDDDIVRKTKFGRTFSLTATYNF